MPVIDPGDLRAACRALHDLAGRDHILPPLIRAAGQSEPPGRIHAFSAGGVDFRFSVFHEPAPASLPLSFDISATRAGLPLEIDRSTRHELLRAFFLGAHAPLTVERRSGTTIYDMALQIAAAFYVPCGELHDETGQFAREDVCERLGAALVERSGGFFASPAICLSVWRSRILQELFGEPPVALETLGPPLIAAMEPAATPGAALSLAPPAAASRRNAPPVAAGRWKLAAIVALSLLGGAALGRLAPGQKIVAPSPATTSENEAPPPARSEPASIRFAEVEPPAGAAVSQTRLAALDLQPGRQEKLRAEPVDARPLENAFEAAPLIAPAALKNFDAPLLAAPLPPPRPRARPAARPVSHAPAGAHGKNPLGVLKQAANSVAQVVRRIRTGSFKVTALNSPYAVRQ